MPNSWIITTAGGPDGPDLIGCHIVVNSEGTAYEFMSPSPGVVLSRTSGRTLPSPPFDFPAFTYGPPGSTAYSWRIRVTTFTGGTARNEAIGTWRNNDVFTPNDTADESGTWVAQAGSGVAADEKADAAGGYA